MNGRGFDLDKDIGMKQTGHSEQRRRWLTPSSLKPLTNRRGGLQERRHISRVVVQPNDIRERKAGMT